MKNLVKNLFAILTTTAGINFVKKNPNFDKIVRKKLVEFSEHLPELTRKWHLQIFGEKMLIMPSQQWTLMVCFTALTLAQKD